jgi:arylformamidase
MPVWPGDPPVAIEQLSSIAAGDAANVSRLHLGSHTGTHVDAPHHFVKKGQTVDNLPLDLLVGPAIVVEVDPPEGNTIGVWELAGLNLPKNTTRLLLKTRNSHLWEDRIQEFERDFVHLAPRTAEWLVGRGVRLVGVDYLSVEAYGTDDHRVHHALLGAGVIIVEGLDLSRVPPGPCHLICLPLKIKDGDGAPARVLVMRG